MRFCKPWWEHWLRLNTYTRPLLWSYQRVTRGWADCDTWSMDYHLCQTLPEMIRLLRDKTHSFPSGGPGCVHGVALGDEQGLEDWKHTLAEMANGIEAGLHVEDSSDEFITELETSTGWRAQIGVNDSKYDWPKIRKYQAGQRKQFKEGMKLFTKHFFDLWD